MRLFFVRYWQTLLVVLLIALSAFSVITSLMGQSLHTGIVLGLLITALLAAAVAERKLSLLRELNIERSHLLHLTFHQLGEPMTILKWSVESMRDTVQNVASKDCTDIVLEHLRQMDEGLGRLNSIVDTLQMAERVDRGMLEYLPQSSNVHSLLQQAAGEWEAQMHVHGQSIHIDADTELQVPMDENLVRVALRQLIENALQYSPDHTQVTLRAAKRGRTLHLWVEDHGVGISRADFAHLFEKYRRGTSAHLLRPDGNGLGLFIVKGIAMRAGGDIRIDRMQEGGTSVHLRFPIRASV